MKVPNLHFLLGFTLATATTAEEPEASIRFSNNDRLAGSIESISSGILVWNSPVLAQPTPFFLKDVIDLDLPPGPPAATEANHEATLTLTNGDTVRGQLAAVSDDKVTLDTWFAGRMNFNRVMVSGLKIEEKATFLYRGPNGLDGWKQSGESPAWTYSRAAFLSHAAGSIAKDDLLPDECSIRFDAAKKSESFAFKVILFSNDPAADNPSSGYELSFQRGSIYLRNCNTLGFLGSTHSQALMENDSIRIELKASRKSGKVCLYVNDAIIEVWSDPDVAKGKFGKTLHFVSQNTLPFRISEIGVSPWDGVIDLMPEPKIGMGRQFGIQGLEDSPKPEKREKPEHGRMELANGDSLEGEVTAIQEGLVTVKTPLGEVKIPASRLRTVALKPVDLERSKRQEGDIRARFPDGSSIVFRLDAMQGETLLGSSQNFGSATFKIAAFNRLEFNIYPKFDDLRRSDEW